MPLCSFQESPCGTRCKHSNYDAVRKPNPVPENKELLIIPNANHCDLYDGGYTEPEGRGKAKQMIPWDRIEEFLKTNLDKPIEP